MKTKASLIATAAALAFAGTSYGQIVIDITGSTAGRSTVDATIKSELSGESVAWYNVDPAKNTTSSSSADGAIYKGGTLNGVPVTVRTFWSGSAAGVRDVSGQVRLDNKFLATSVNAANVELNGVDAVLAPASAETVAEFGFSDVKQSATDYQANPLVDQESVLVIPFRFIASESVPLTVTNITSQQAVTHFTKGGETPLSLFTGLAANSGTIVYALGRDDDSGTRITALAETGAGVFTQMTQFRGTVTGTEPGATLTITANDYAGTGGYASGGDLQARLAASGALAVGYLGISDATTALGNGARSLTYNGVPYSTEAVQNGSYTYWSYYQQMRMALPAGPALNLYNSTKNALKGLATGSSTIRLTDMKVERAADGATVTPL